MGHILVIDDDKTICEMIKRLFERNGYHVTIAENGREGLLMFHHNSFDVVITDVLMPEMDGIEIIMQLIKEDPNAKIIAISGGGRIPSHEYLQLAGELGAVKTFVKPVNNKVLLDAVRELCGHSIQQTAFEN